MMFDDQAAVRASHGELTAVVKHWFEEIGRYCFAFCVEVYDFYVYEVVFVDVSCLKVAQE